MALKAAIKKAITGNSKYRAIKVWPVTVEDTGLLGDTEAMTIEVTVIKKKKPKKK